ncbi:hypothetical protein AGR2A_Cc110116 [Agrobacterium genomosp. 2 str. CFBP 5494]|uniref:Uncharacterized protein n=1 Tax=Agrobacterium genomosp. 2 str. CFBP 5494 TaxID=1183436 RepID=A0A9W5AYC6_9HYPH|nr:hypothetical protein AGR2A_Cc110116 [Agrobacterium genomosp. 2 str. CFBP 5494]
MHGNLAADGVENCLVAFRLQRNENAELADAVAGSVVDVGRDNAVRHFQRSGTTQRHVLADRCDRVLDAVRNGLAGCRIDGSGNSVNGAIGGESNLGDAADEVLESVVTGNEVGFRVQLDNDSLVTHGGNADQTFGSRAAGLLVGLRDALGAQPVDRRFHVAIGFSKSLLAVHHACARLFAQFLHHCGCDFGHCVPLIGSIGQPAEFAVPKFWVMTVPGRIPFETLRFRQGACAFPSAAASPNIEMMGAALV